jgi:hypothetical protein
LWALAEKLLIAEAAKAAERALYSAKTSYEGFYDWIHEEDGAGVLWQAAPAGAAARRRCAAE